MKSVMIFMLLLPMLANAQHLCNFMPKNDMQIPVGAQFSNTGMTEETFNGILDRIESVYSDVIRSRGATLEIVRRWDDGEVNAYANQIGSLWQVHMFGGMARHSLMTPDGFAMIACHELGHHIGGAPKYTGQWASNEGQSDYWATLKCTRRIWAQDNNRAIMRGKNVPAHVVKNCTESYANSEDAALCMRSALAGKALGNVLASFEMANQPDFETPDQTQVRRTSHGHPRAQCRLDTYYAGAVCDMSVNTEVSDTDQDKGVCSRSYGQTRGVRPLCWFNPASHLEEEPTFGDLLLVSR